jgi:hypothetical protein
LVDLDGTSLPKGQGYERRNEVDEGTKWRLQIKKRAREQLPPICHFVVDMNKIIKVSGGVEAF